MSGEKDHPFTPGTYVLVNANYSSYDKGAFTPDKVLKLHKSGRFTLASDPKKQWSAHISRWDDDKLWLGYPTERRGFSIYSTSLRLLDAAAKAEWQAADDERDHAKRCQQIALLFSTPRAVPHTLSESVTAAIAKATP